MRQFSKISVLMVVAVFLVVGSTMAGEITAYDKTSKPSTSSGWYRGSSTSDTIAEDNEVEWSYSSNVGMVATDGWDLEGVFLDGTILTMVGTFNFISMDGYHGGDLFIDVTGDAQYGLGADDGNIRNGYDYVFDLNYNDTSKTFTHNLYSIDNNATLLDVYYYNSQESSPWRYSAGGRQIGVQSEVGYGKTSAYNQFLGPDDARYYLSVDLGLIRTDIGSIAFTSHYTMGCGNDNLIGVNPVPEPATMLLLGSGLIGLAGYGKRRFRKN